MFPTFTDFENFVREYVNRRNPSVDSNLPYFILKGFWTFARLVSLRECFWEKIFTYSSLNLNPNRISVLTFEDLVVRPDFFVERIYSVRYGYNDVNGVGRRRKAIYLSTPEVPSKIWDILNPQSDIVYLPFWIIRHSDAFLKIYIYIPELLTNYINSTNESTLGFYVQIFSYQLPKTYFAFQNFPHTDSTFKVWQRWGFEIAKATNYEVLRFLGEVELANEELNSLVQQIPVLQQFEVQGKFPNFSSYVLPSGEVVEETRGEERRERGGRRR